MLSPRKLLAAALPVAALALTAPIAGADTLGPPSFSVSDGSFPATGCPGDPCELWNAAVPGVTLAAPADGRVTSVSLIPSENGDYAVTILRGGLSTVEVVARSSTFTLVAGQVQTLTVDLPTEAGDLVGIEGRAPWAKTATGALNPYDFELGAPSLGTLISPEGVFGNTSWDYNAEWEPAGGQAIPAPIVSSLSTSTGSTAGGETITVKGEDFSDGIGVLFGDTPASSVTLVSSRELRVVTPAHAAGAVNLRAVDVHGTSGDTAFTFVAPAAATPVTPAAASTAPAAAATPRHHRHTYHHKRAHARRWAR